MIHPTATIYEGRVVLGQNVQICAGARIGTAPEIVGHDTEKIGRVIIGDNTVIRENVTIQAGSNDGDTVIGKDCYIMSGAYIAHDCKIGDQVHISGNASLAGAVTVMSRSVIGIGASVHQFTTVGEICMIGGGAFVKGDFPRHSLIYGVPAKVRGVNKVGLRRAGLNESEFQRTPE